MMLKYYKLAEVLYNRYGIDRGNQILCRGNIANLIRIYV